MKIKKLKRDDPKVPKQAEAMFYGNLSQLGKKSNSVIRSRSVIGSKIGVMPDQWSASL